MCLAAKIIVIVADLQQMNGQKIALRAAAIGLRVLLMASSQARLSPWASAHRGNWGQLTPWKTELKIKIK